MTVLLSVGTVVLIRGLRIRIRARALSKRRRRIRCELGLRVGVKMLFIWGSGRCRRRRRRPRRVVANSLGGLCGTMPRLRVASRTARRIWVAQSVKVEWVWFWNYDLLEPIH